MNSADPSWELIASGDLFSSEQLTELQADYIRVPPGQKTVIEWLLENKTITDYHVKVLQAGHSGPFRYGDYLVQDRISGGAFDGGFKSVHVPSRHPVLLDFVNGEQTESQWNEVRKRAYDSRFFASPFLLRCHEAVEVDDFKFLVFEDFNATPLPSILAKNGHLNPQAACDVIRRICKAMQVIHQAGFVHGHICSANVLVENGKHIKIAFDPEHEFVTLVKANADPDSATSLHADYAAPELGTPGQLPDIATDIYAIGCLFYELLTGKPPFPIGDLRERMQQHATQRVKPLEKLGYDKNLAQFVYFMMAKDRTLRFQSVGDILTQLDSLPNSGNPKPTPRPTLKTFNAYNLYLEQHTPAPEQSPSENASPGFPPPSIVAPPITSHPAGNQASDRVEVQMESDHARPKPVGVKLDLPQDKGSVAIENQASNAPQEYSDNKLGLEVGEEDKSATLSFRSRQKSALKKTLVPLAITLAILALPTTFLIIKYKDQIFTAAASNESEDDKEKKTEGGTGEADPKDANETQNTTNVIFVDDDNRTLWEDPTNGEPISLDNVPSGVRLLLAIRGAELFKNDSEGLILKSLGTGFESEAKKMEDAAGISWREMDRLIFSIHDNPIVDGKPENEMEQLPGSFLINPVDKKPLIYWLAKWGDCTKIEAANGSFYKSTSGWCYFTPDPEDQINQFLVAPESLVTDVLQNGGAILTTGASKLLRSTDSDRQVNLLIIPTDLTSPSGITLFKGYWKKVINLIRWYMGGEDKIQAAYLSLHLENGAAYIETGLNPQLDKDPFSLADELRERILSAPRIVDDYMLDINAERYWKKLARELPDMIGDIVRNTRVGVDAGITITNSWNNGLAAHNLLTAMEHTFAFENGSAGAVTTAPPTKTTPQTIEALLQEVRTIEIANDDLNIAVDKIVGEIKDDYPKLPFDFQILINGTHLMDDGITKNQRLVDFKVENKPLGDILAAFTFAANTIKTATGPDDPTNLLIWVIQNPDPSDPKKKHVLITTRKAAAREGYKLPQQFVPK